MKARLKGAQTGRNLLKKKSDALSMRFRQILRKIIEVSLKWAFVFGPNVVKRTDDVTNTLFIHHDLWLEAVAHDNAQLIWY